MMGNKSQENAKQVGVAFSCKIDNRIAIILYHFSVGYTSSLQSIFPSYHYVTI